MNESDFILTSVLEFPDRYEGQVFHRGTQEDCIKTANIITALSYSGSERILSSRLQQIPASQFDLKNGECWRVDK
jgi:hypothetical protein